MMVPIAASSNAALSIAWRSVGGDWLSRRSLSLTATLPVRPLLETTARVRRKDPASIILDRKSVEEWGLVVGSRRRVRVVLGWRRGPRLFGWCFCSRRPCFGGDRRLMLWLCFGLSSKYRLRGHVGRGCWRICESSCCVVVLGLWQASALAGDYRR
jgi:hypothetical protein